MKFVNEIRKRYEESHILVPAFINYLSFLDLKSILLNYIRVQNSLPLINRN